MFSCIVLAAGLLAAPRARAWNFQEHTKLGSEGYQAACDDLAATLKLAVPPSSLPSGAQPNASDPCLSTTDRATVRWCLACRTYSPTLYGQSVAIAGDHVGSPDELMSIEGQTIAASAFDYTFLALVNWEHFHPAAPQNWRRFHNEALEKAVNLANKNDLSGTLARDFAQVFNTSAFADHFLEDAFAAGHAGFNRPSSGAVASKAFHDVWNESGRLVKSATGECWLQYGDGKLQPLPDRGRQQIAAAEKASVLDVLQTFVTGERDPAREVRPTYYMPAEIDPQPLPGKVWAPRGALEPTDKRPPVIEKLAQQQRIGLRDETSKDGVDSAPQEDHRCKDATVTVPIDGMSNPALINGGVDFYGGTAIDRSTTVISFDVVYTNRLFSLMALPFSWEGGLGLGHLRRDNREGWAPSVVIGVLAPPIYLINGLWRNEIGGGVKGYVGPDEPDAYVSPFLRSSLEAATVIFRLQAGPTFDFRTGRAGVVAALGLEFSGLRWITGGGALTDF